MILHVSTFPCFATLALHPCMNNQCPVPPLLGSSGSPLPACSFWRTALSKMSIEWGTTQAIKQRSPGPQPLPHTDASCVTFCTETCLKQGITSVDHVLQASCTPACLNHAQALLVWPGRPSHLFPGCRILHTPGLEAPWATLDH